MSTPSVDNMIEMVELNIGNWKPKGLAVVDINHKVWGEKGSFSDEILDYYKKFPLSELHPGDSIHNSNSFLMKITEKTGVIVVMPDVNLARLSAINLRGRINALSEFYGLEKLIKEKKKGKEKSKKSRLGDAMKTEEGIW
ncbi:MAG: hypothetical protein WED07_16215 [Candidatus Freyarchaeum deiterrae]